MVFTNAVDVGVRRIFGVKSINSSINSYGRIIMFKYLRPFFCIAAVAIIATGCQTQTSPVSSNTESSTTHQDSDDHQHDDHSDAEVATAMAKLSPEDRKEAEAQKFCAVMGDNLLGSMGTPLKVSIDGAPVFLCCSGCKSKALKNPEQTLAAVAKMKADNSGVK